MDKSRNWDNHQDPQHCMQERQGFVTSRFKFFGNRWLILNMHKFHEHEAVQVGIRFQRSADIDSVKLI